MLEDNNDGGESSMHVMHPPTPEPLKPGGMLHFWHMELGKEKNKFVFFGTYLFFWYTLEEWQQKLLKLTLNRRK